MTAANEALLIDNIEVFQNNGFDFVINKDGISVSFVLPGQDANSNSRGANETSRIEQRSNEWQLAFRTCGRRRTLVHPPGLAIQFL